MTIDLPIFIAVFGTGILLFWPRFSDIMPRTVGITKNELSESSKKSTQIFISVVVLFAALYIVVFQPDADESQKNWAFGTIGTLLGFWLKPS